MNGVAPVSQVDIYNTVTCRPTTSIYALGLVQRHVEDDRPSDGQSRPPLRGLPRFVARAGVRTEWPAGAGDWLDYRRRALRYVGFIAPRTVERHTVVNDSKTFAPRVGFAYDLTGDNRTVLKAYYRPVTLELGGHAGRPGEPGRRGTAPLRVPVVHGRPARRSATSTATACSTARSSSARSTPPRAAPASSASIAT